MIFNEDLIREEISGYAQAARTLATFLHFPDGAAENRKAHKPVEIENSYAVDSSAGAASSFIPFETG
jgi:hypothetical protein